MSDSTTLPVSTEDWKELFQLSLISLYSYRSLLVIYLLLLGGLDLVSTYWILIPHKEKCEVPVNKKV